MLTRIKRNLIPFIIYYLFFSILLIFFGEAGSDIIYFIGIFGVMLLHILIVLVLMMNNYNKTEGQYINWNFIDLIIILTLFIIFYLNYEYLLNILFEFNQALKN